MYTLYCSGIENQEETFETCEGAKKAYDAFVSSFSSSYMQTYDDMEDAKKYLDYLSVEETSFIYADRDQFQAAIMFKTPITTTERIFAEVIKARVGLMRFSFEGYDSDVCKNHLDKISAICQEEMFGG